MAVRKEFLAAYERFALKEPPSAQAAVFLPGLPIKAERLRPERPDPPASKPVREPITDGTTHFSAWVTGDPVKLPHDHQGAMITLVEFSEKLMKERDAWKAMAESLTLDQPPINTATQEGKRLEALRRLLARELHPDRAEFASKEGALLNALFQRLWPQIDCIARGQATV
jgi:hypothetical protein